MIQISKELIFSIYILDFTWELSNIGKQKCIYLLEII